MVFISQIHADEYWRFIRQRSDVNFQQTPQWSDVRGNSWEHKLLGWFDDTNTVVAVAVVRFRSLPASNRRFAYIAQGPILDWGSPSAPYQLKLLVDYLQDLNVFGLRVTPPVTIYRWSADTVKQGLASSTVEHFGDMTPDETQAAGTRLLEYLHSSGWRPAPDGNELNQPRFNFRLDLHAGNEDAVLAAMSKYWRKNIRKSQRSGLEVTLGSRADLPEVHGLYAETADRNGFAPMPLSYFCTLWDVMTTNFPGQFYLHLARSEGILAAANGTLQVGKRAQGVFAATSTRQSKTKPSNAVYWALLQQAISDGAELFDISGVVDALGSTSPGAGLVSFKAEMGADAYEHLGSWDFPIQPRLYSAFARALGVYSSSSSRLRRALADIGKWRNQRSLSKQALHK